MIGFRTRVSIFLGNLVVFFCQSIEKFCLLVVFGVIYFIKRYNCERRNFLMYDV